jgi:hypothetical protein
LTRVTRIFQESVFTEITSAARAECRAGFFLARMCNTPAAACACKDRIANRELQKTIGVV